MFSLTDTERMALKLKINHSPLWKLPLEVRREWLSLGSTLDTEKIAPYHQDILNIQNWAMEYVFSEMNENQLNNIDWEEGSKSLNRAITNYSQEFQEEGACFIAYLYGCRPFSIAKNYRNISFRTVDILLNSNKRKIKQAIRYLNEHLATLGKTIHDYPNKKELEVLSNNLGISEDKLCTLLKHARILSPTLSLDAPMLTGEDTNFGDALADTGVDVENQVTNSEFLTVAVEALANELPLVVPNGKKGRYYRCFFSNDIIAQLKDNNWDFVGFTTSYDLLLPAEKACVGAMEHGYVSHLYVPVSLPLLSLECLSQNKLDKPAIDASVGSYFGVKPPNISYFRKLYNALRQDVLLRLQA